jgi:hypothetical protein
MSCPGVAAHCILKVLARLFMCTEFNTLELTQASEERIQSLGKHFNEDIAFPSHQNWMDLLPDALDSVKKKHQ